MSPDILRFYRFAQRTALAVTVAACLLPSAGATELKPETSAAFDRYIHATEARMESDQHSNQFLILDRLPEERRQAAYAQLRRNGLYIQQLHTDEDGHPLRIDGGLVHHWVGVIFIPGKTLAQTVAEIENYNNDQYFYKPDVRKSRLLSRQGSEFKVYLQFFYDEAGITAVLNGSFDVNYIRVSDSQAVIRSYSTRIVELKNPYKPNQYELPVGDDRGFLWRLYSYWRVEQKDGGAYLEIEAISLSRTVPAVLAPVVDPVVRRVSRRFIARLLNGTRIAVNDDRADAGAEPSLAAASEDVSGAAATAAPAIDTAMRAP